MSEVKGLWVVQANQGGWYCYNLVHAPVPHHHVHNWLTQAEAERACVMLNLGDMPYESVGHGDTIRAFEEWKKRLGL